MGKERVKGQPGANENPVRVAMAMERIKVEAVT